MRYYTKQDQDNAAAAYIDSRRAAADLYPVIADVIRGFNGKVYNVRFERALQERTGKRVYARKRHIWIEVYLWNSGDQITLAQIEIENLTDGKRIPADKMLVSARERRQELLKQAAEVERACADLETVKERLGALYAARRALLDSVPYIVRDIYGLD